MSNSSLVNCTVLSPNHSGARTHAIDTITPHCVVGQLSAEAIGNCFPSGRGASCNYGIGKDGRVVLVVDEGNRSWCTSSNANDQRAVTIEVASDSSEPYAFTSAAYNKLVALCTDICKRNGKSKLIWFGDKSKTLSYNPGSDEMVLTVHRWFANKSCPGNWMYAKMGQLANSVTASLGGGSGDVSGGGGTGGSFSEGDVGYVPGYSTTDTGGNVNSAITSPSTEANTAAVKDMVTDLFNWNIKNNVFENGTIVVKGKASYKVGERIILESSGIEYYVESVSQNFNCYGTWTTALGVTRGILPEERFTPPWGCAEEMTPAVMSAIVQQTSGADIDWTNLPEPAPSTGGSYGGGTGGDAAYNPTGGSVNGNTVTLPAGMGSIYTHMGWQCITSPSSMQYKLREQAGMKFDKDGIGIINGRYVVACTTTYGKVGDYLDVKLSNGQSFKCVIGDIKNQNDSGCNQWGHQGGKSVIEFVVDKTGGFTGYNGSKTIAQIHPEWKNSTTVSVTNEGSYWG